MFRNICLCTLFLTVSSTVASAQVSFERKYPEGTKSTNQKEQKTKQTLTLNGFDIDTTATVFVVSTSSIGKREADGTLKVEEKVNTLQSEISFPGGSVQFDSANPDKKVDLPQLEGVIDLFRSIFRLPITVEFDAKNKITQIKLPEGEFEKLPPTASERLNPESLKKMIEQANAFMPDEPVKKGDTWERSTESNIGAGQTLSLRTKYEYAGTIEKDGATLEKITGKSFEVTYAVNGNPMLQVTKSDLKVNESENVILFDRQLGAIVSNSSKIQISGPLTLVVNGMELAGAVDLTIEEKTTRQK